MLSTIIKKEILESLLGFRFLLAFLLCTILIPLGLYVNLKEYEQRLRDYHESVQLYEARMKGNAEMNMKAEGYRPPSPLSIFSIGLEQFLPNKVLTSREEGFTTLNTRGVENPQSLLFGKIDFLFNMNFVISILALILIFNSIPEEKEMGTLRMLLANPVSKSSILLGKLIGNYLVLLIPFFVSILIGSLILNLSSSISLFSGENFSRFLIIIGLTVLFILTFFTLGMFVSLLTHRSTTSIISLLFIWVILALTFPKMSTMLAEISYPVKSKQVLDLQKTLLRETLDKEKDTRVRQLYDQVAAEYGSDPRSVSAGPTQSEFQKIYLQRKAPFEEEYANRLHNELERLTADYERERRIQESIAKNISRLSPISCYTYIISEIANTGTIEAKTFEEDAKRFQEKVREEVYDRYHIERYGGTSGGSASYIRTDPNVATKETMSRFQHQFADLSEVFGAIWVDILLLCVFNLVFFAGSYVSFLRYDAR